MLAGADRGLINVLAVDGCEWCCSVAAAVRCWLGCYANIPLTSSFLHKNNEWFQGTKAPPAHTHTQRISWNCIKVSNFRHDDDGGVGMGMNDWQRPPGDCEPESARVVSQINWAKQENSGKKTLKLRFVWRRVDRTITANHRSPTSTLPFLTGAPPIPKLT